MATNYTGNVTPSLSNAPASSWTDDAAKRSHVGNTYLVTGSGGTAGNVYAFEEYAAPLVKQASGLPADIVTITDGGEDLPMVKAEVSLSPIQSLNGYDHPWAAGAGKNKLAPKTHQDGTTRLWLGTDASTPYYLPLKAGTYTLSASLNVSARFIVRSSTDTGNTNVGSASTEPFGTFVIDTDNTYSVWLYTSSGITAADVNWFQLESGSTVSAFSPYENICPISGHTGATLYRTGKNLCYKTETAYVSKGATSAIYYTGSGTSLFFNCKAGETYVVSGVSLNRYIWAIYDTEPTSGSTSYDFGDVFGQSVYTFTATKTGVCVFYANNGTVSTDTAQVEIGSSASAYFPFNPSSASYPVTFPQTVYGGTFDWVSGKLKVTMANIASYNGETIGEPWLSSMDAYVAGATPTTGAQVVHTITTTETTLTPAQVQTLLGLNNVWASDGQISALTYQSNQFIPKYDWFETWNMPKITRNNGSVIVLPYPKEYTPEIHDVDAATTGRNAAGTMIRDRVAIKHKFNYVFPPLSQADATELLAATKDASFTLTTASPETGAKTNYRVYAGDKSLPVYWMPNHDTASWLYSSVSVNLIEM